MLGPTMKPRGNLILCSIAVAALIVVAVLFFGRDWTPTDRLFRQAQTLLRREHYREAEELALRLTRRAERWREGWLLAAEAAARQRRFADAKTRLENIPDDGSLLCAAKWMAIGLLEIQGFHRLSSAEMAFRNVLKIDSQRRDAHQQLAMLLSLEGRHWDALPHRMALIQHRQADLTTLVLLALGDSANDRPEEVGAFYKVEPNDTGVLCGKARQDLLANKPAEAKKELETLCQKEPSWLIPRCWLGSRLLVENDQPAFARWIDSLPQGLSLTHPEVWFLRGRFALLSGRREVAGRYFAQAIHFDPNHLAACYQIGQLLMNSADEKIGTSFLDRSKLLSEYLGVAKSYVITQRLDALPRAAQLAEQLGLTAEAIAWHETLATLFKTQPQGAARAEFHLKQVNRLQKKSLKVAQDGRTDVDTIDGLWRRLPSDWVRPPKDELVMAKENARASGAGAGFHARFVDQAKELGLMFSYFNGSRPETKSEFMYEFSGGGVAALDYDLDGHVDLYLTQGCEWPVDTAQRKHLDQIFRNNSGCGFHAVTHLAGVIEPGFSQGVTVGDYDNDGFPDVYVANIGANRFFRNNGDGTFLDVTGETKTGGNRWTTSCVLADLNNDGFPDLYTVNYVEGDQLFEIPCRLPNGATRLCTPHEFEASQDQLFLNLGDGEFREITSDAGVEIPNGKGLGIVAADFEGTGWLNLFVANDAVPNFYFGNETARAGEQPRFVEKGFASGLAVDQEGHAEACMGVAAGDADDDGSLDLFVTNFHSESNTLYLQRSVGQFQDATRNAGLEDPSLDMLGFGTQFLDMNLDGYRDLILANGHVGDLSSHGVPYRMFPQCFLNAKDGRFTELTADKAGPFFERKRLGRGLARLDVNRDGREDFVVSHLEDPVALVLNQSASTGNFFAIRLVGTKLDRDALGTEVRVRSGAKTSTQQLVAGDGYQASNERRMVFGIGDAKQIDELQIRWRSGRIDEFRCLRPNVECVVIEAFDERATSKMVEIIGP